MEVYDNFQMVIEGESEMQNMQETYWSFITSNLALIDKIGDFLLGWRFFESKFDWFQI